jgi:hypothetical protein
MYMPAVGLLTVPLVFGFYARTVRLTCSARQRGSVAVHGNTVIAAASPDSSTGTCVNASETGGSGIDHSGAVYAFH